MKTLHFKTNISCGSCIATISPELNFKDKIQDWSVDIASPDKTLTITTDYTEAEIKEILEKVGYKAEKL
ncbi:MAG: heavy-metal-associated domain-containing protein [Cytophaga sp.]|uniref:heavy-metal-associated domain-containing protein n=1 Tax=Cytophaga sp. TaxID=29535 RepID=UPI003F7EFE3C